MCEYPFFQKSNQPPAKVGKAWEKRREHGTNRDDCIYLEGEDERMPKLSIIIPVYNVESYLPECIKSVFNQTFLDYELILVDDGSPDRCGEICDEYSRKDSRIRVLHQKNAGVSAARNAGLRIARGKLISFVDADDFLHPRMYEIMIAAMTESCSDIGVCDFRPVGEGENYAFAEIEQVNYQQLSAKEYITKLYSIPPTFYNSCCNKIFSTNCLTAEFDSTLAICEDAKFLAQNVRKESRVCYIPCGFYYVLTREGSATRSKASFFLKEPPVRKEICDILKNRFPETYPTAYWFYVDRCFLVAGMQQKKSDAAKEAKRYLTEAISGLIKIRGISIVKKIKYIGLYLRMTILS